MFATVANVTAECNSLVNANVPVALGNVTVASDVNDAGEVKLTLCVPFPDASYISTAAALAPFLTLILELNIGVDE